MIALACFLEDSSGLAIVASHLYDFGRHYSEIKRQNVLSSIEKANQSGDELKKKELEKAITSLKEYKNEIAEEQVDYFEIAPRSFEFVAASHRLPPQPLQLYQ